MLYELCENMGIRKQRGLDAMKQGITNAVSSIHKIVEDYNDEKIDDSEAFEKMQYVFEDLFPVAEQLNYNPNLQREIEDMLNDGYATQSVNSALEILDTIRIIVDGA